MLNYGLLACGESMDDIIIEDIYDTLGILNNDNSLSDIDKVGLHLDIMYRLNELKHIPPYLVSDIITYNNNHKVKIIF